MYTSKGAQPYWSRASHQGGGAGRLDASEERLGISDCVSAPIEPLDWADGVGDQSAVTTLVCSLVG